MKFECSLNVDFINNTLYVDFPAITFTLNKTRGVSVCVGGFDFEICCTHTQQKHRLNDAI